MLNEEGALALLASDKSITYDDLDDIFRAFGFVAEFELPEITWYRHQRYGRCGEFRAQPKYEFSVLSEEQKAIVRRILDCVRVLRRLEGAQES